MPRFWWLGLANLTAPLVALMAQSGTAPERMIRGTVREAISGMPLSHAQVLVKGTQFAAQADDTAGENDFGFHGHYIFGM